MNYFIGIDVGLKGAISLLSQSKESIIEVIDSKPMPINKIDKRVDFKVLNQYIKKWNIDCKYQIKAAALEKQKAIRGQGLLSTSYTFQQMGTVIGILIGNNIEYETIPPEKWQRIIPEDIEILDELKDKNIKPIKKKSISYCNSLFKYVKLKQNKRYLDGIADSILVGIYYISSLEI